MTRLANKFVNLRTMRKLSPEYYRYLLAPLFKKRKCIVAVGSLADSIGLIAVLNDLGADNPYVLANSFGAGPCPLAENAMWSIIGDESEDLMSATRGYASRLQNLPADVVDSINRYDPTGTAVVLLGSLFSLKRVAGREVFAFPQPEWIKLEDKTVIDAIWDAVGVARAPYSVISINRKRLREAVEQLKDESGTVWAGDAREGYNAGGSYTRWVNNDVDFENALAFFENHCDKVRVMPFLKGIPCSIHGIVFSRSVIVFRPVELVVFRTTNNGQLMYVGNGTFWDPPNEHRDYMRQIAYRMGHFLRKEVAYRGAFNIDGVLTSTGFLPTELNARYGAALNTISQSLPTVPLLLIDMAARRGERLQYYPQHLENILVKASDLHRNGGGGVLTKTTWDDQCEYPLISRKDGDFHIARANEAPDAWVTRGKSQIGGIIRIRLNPTKTSIGELIAPTVAKILAFTDHEFGTSFGRLDLLHRFVS